MRKRPPTRKKVVPKISSEEALQDIAEITLVLENRRTVRFHVADELCIPADPEELHNAALNGHARFAFWAHQAARAQGKLRSSERELHYLEAQTYLAARAYLENIRPKLPYIEGARIQSQVDYDDAVDARRKEVDELREQWTLVAAVRDAIEHRTHLLRRLLAQDQNANRG